jgi:copper homeostasis protein
MNYSLEICAYNAQSVAIAAAVGAQRVELCSGRLEGGTTPGYGLLLESMQFPSIGVFPIIRPRGGDFCYSKSEFNEMCRDMEFMREQGVQGIVTGILLPDGNFDIPRMHHLKLLAGHLEFCVHRAIDMSRNPLEAIEQLVDLGVTRVLSSGARNTAIEGIDMLRNMVEASNGRIQIMAGSGVNACQIEILWQAGIRHFHASASGKFPSAMEYRNTHIQMGKEGEQDEFTIYNADAQKIEDMLQQLKHRSTPSQF